jgi:hypothetical protein
MELPYTHKITASYRGRTTVYELLPINFDELSKWQAIKARWMGATHILRLGNVSGFANYKSQAFRDDGWYWHKIGGKDFVNSVWGFVRQ